MPLELHEAFPPLSNMWPVNIALTAGSWERKGLYYYREVGIAHTKRDLYVPRSSRGQNWGVGLGSYGFFGWLSMLT
jgi:hypothetical protein